MKARNNLLSCDRKYLSNPHLPTHNFQGTFRLTLPAYYFHMDAHVRGISDLTWPRPELRASNSPSKPAPRVFPLKVNGTIPPISQAVSSEILVFSLSFHHPSPYLILKQVPTFIPPKHIPCRPLFLHLCDSCPSPNHHFLP